MTPVGQPEDLWYVRKVKTGLLLEGGETGGDSYKGTTLRQYLQIQSPGSLEVLLEASGHSDPIVQETLDVGYRQVVKIERTLPNHCILNFRTVLRAGDGRVGIREIGLS